MTTSATYKLTGQVALFATKSAMMAQMVLDFATTTLTNAVIYQMFQCPEDYMVLSAGYEILRAETGTCTMDLGKAGGTELLSAIDITGAAGTKGQSALANPLAFEDSDTIDVQINSEDANVGKVRLWWVGIDVSELTTDNDLV